MPYQEVELLGFTPDLPCDTPGASLGNNSIAGFITTPTGFSPAPTLSTSTLTGAVADVTYGSTTIKKADGTQYNLLGTSTKIYTFTAPGTLTDVTGGTLTADATHTWSFAQFGNVTLIGGGNAVALRAATLPAASAVITNAPQAQKVIVCGPSTSPFAMCFNWYRAAEGSNPDGIFWSALGDYTNWTQSIQSQCGNVNMRNPGGQFINAIAYRDGVLAWKADAMYLGTYVGGATQWQWQLLASDIGCCGKNMAVVINDVAYFADRRGFWEYDGSYPKKMRGYLHDWWAAQIAGPSGAVIGVDDTCQMTWDPSRHNLWVSYGSGSATRQRSFLTFNQLSGKWISVGQLYIELSGPTAAREIMQQGSTQYFIGCQTLADSSLIRDSSYTDPNPLTTNGWNFWFQGDPYNYLEITRLVLPFSNRSTVTFGTIKPSLSSGTAVIGVARSDMPGTGTVGAVVNFVAADTGARSFDGRAKGHFLQPSIINLQGVYEFNKLGIVSQVQENRGV